MVKSIARTTRAFPQRGTRPALTIAECVLATAILAIVGLSMVFIIAGARAQFTQSSAAIRGTRLADQLIEEISTRPYAGNGPTRATWSLPRYNAFTETPGSLVDPLGAPCPTLDQRYTRSASVVPTSLTIPDLGGFTVSGQLVTVNVEATTDSWKLARFVPEPIVP